MIKVCFVLIIVGVLLIVIIDYLCDQGIVSEYVKIYKYVYML